MLIRRSLVSSHQCKEQRSGLVIICGSRPQQLSSQLPSNGTTAIAGLSHPPTKTFRTAPSKSPNSKSKHKSPDKHGAVEEDARHMEMEADALRRAAHHLHDSLPSSDSLLLLAPRETPRIEKN